MLKDSYVLEENRIKLYYFRVEDIGRNSKNTVVTGTELRKCPNFTMHIVVIIIIIIIIITIIIVKLSL